MAGLSIQAKGRMRAARVEARAAQPVSVIFDAPSGDASTGCWRYGSAYISFVSSDRQAAEA